MLCASIWNDTTIVIKHDTIALTTWPCPHCHQSKLKKEVLCKDRNNASLNLVAFCYVLYFHPVSSCTSLLVRYTWWWIKMKEWSFFFPLSDGVKEAIKLHVFRRPDSHYECSECGFSSNRASVVHVHVEAKHLQTSGFECPICQKHCPTRNSLNIHKYRYHRSVQ